MNTVAEVIVESPVEGPEGSVSEYGTAEEVVEEKVQEKEVVTPRPSVPQRASTETSERRKSLAFGLFGKSGSGSSDGEPQRSPKPIRSMTNLRRSVAGTLSSRLRPKSTLIVNTSGKPDFSRLPPSPALLSPTSPGLRQQQQQQGGGLRVPLSPTIHNRGSILMSTKHIEDDESRRLSEMAFLDF